MPIMDTRYHETTNMPPKHHQEQHQQMSTNTMLFAIIVGITIGGPLLALMAVIFLATMTLFLVASPLLIIFSPIIVGAGFVYVGALAGLSAAGLTAVAGISALSWVFRSFKIDQIQPGFESTAGKLMDYGERAIGKFVDYGENVKDSGKEWGSNLKQSVQNPDYRTVNKA